MKLAGQKIEGANVVDIVIPRGNDIKNAIVFRAQAILDFEEFDTLCPRPTAPVKLMRGGKQVPDTDRPSFRQAIEDYAKKRIAYTVLKSLEATPDLEWETVKMDEPNTWLKFEEELKEAGFTWIEIHRIVNEVMSVNALDEAKLEQARADFLAFRQAEDERLLSQEDDLNSTPSGEPASDSESDHQESETAGTTTT